MVRRKGRGHCCLKSGRLCCFLFFLIKMVLVRISAIVKIMRMLTIKTVKSNDDYNSNGGRSDDDVDNKHDDDVDNKDDDDV